MVGAAVPDRIVNDNLQLMLCYLQQTAASWGQHLIVECLLSLQSTYKVYLEKIVEHYKLCFWS